jgi:signal transduction histidine kinase
MRASLSRLLMRPTRPPLRSGILIAAFCVTIETLLAYPVGRVADGASLGVVYLPGVLLVATVWGLGLGAVTVVASTVVFFIFHLAPVHRFIDSDTEEWVVLSIFLAVALLAAFVADLARSRAVEIEKRHQDSGKLQAALDHQTSVVAIAAHELQNPLAAISALTHTLQDPRYQGTSQQRTAIADRIAERAEAQQALVRKLLTTSRIDARPERGRPQCVLVLQLIFELLGEFEAASQDVHVSCSPALKAFVDRGEFSEMLINYLDNALTHGSPPLDVRVAERDGWIEVRVFDDGPGVPEDFRPRLFERFSRGPGAARQAEGSGLGLWIVRGLARANGGDAFYEPGESGGACFGLRLPRAQSAASGVRRVGGGASPGSSGAPPD